MYRVQLRILRRRLDRYQESARGIVIHDGHLTAMPMIDPIPCCPHKSRLSTPTSPDAKPHFRLMRRIARIVPRKCRRTRLSLNEVSRLATDASLFNMLVVQQSSWNVVGFIRYVTEGSRAVFAREYRQDPERSVHGPQGGLSSATIASI
jgi:hypothetical protein